MARKITYVHVLLGEHEYGFLRAGGAGLANCLFFVTRGIIMSRKHGWRLLRPTWERFGFGPIIRRETDKRFYFGLFRNWFSKETILKIWCLVTRKRLTEETAITNGGGVVLLRGWWDYHRDMPAFYDEIKAYFMDNIRPTALCHVPVSFERSISVHVRLGDMPDNGRVPLVWSMKMLALVLRETGFDVNILVFSDGSDSELAPLLALPNAKRVFFGNAIADIVAISRTQAVIGTYSTFSWWGAFLGQIPIIVPKENSGCCHIDPGRYCVMDMETDLPEIFKRHLRDSFTK